MKGPTRREFNTLILAGAAASVLPGCRQPSFDGTVTPTNGSAVLTFAQFPQLSSVGGSALVDVTGSFPIVVVRSSATAADALSATCTHEGCLMNFQSNVIHCDCHNANFALDGEVLRGPTTVNLPTYTATVGNDAITVDIAD
jgi:cytochrome b6-f complex iron-sulfur subunit